MAIMPGDPKSPPGMLPKEPSAGPQMQRPNKRDPEPHPRAVKASLRQAEFALCSTREVCG